MLLEGGILFEGGFVVDTGIEALPTYSVSPTSSSINEGESLTFNVTTTNVNDSTTLYWTVLDITTDSADFVATSGSFTITSNTGSFNITTTNDVTTEGSQTFQMQIRTVSTSGTVVATSSTVTIIDSSTNPTYSVTPTSSSINEGESLTFNVATTNVVNGTTLYWTILDITTSSSDFVAISGSFTITSNAGSFNITTINDVTTEGSQTFQMQIRTVSTSGTVVATSNTITIIDTSTNPTYSVTPTSSSVNEGSSLTFNVATTNVTDSTTLYWTVLNITTSSADFVATSGSFTITSNAGSFNITASTDVTTEGPETFQVQIRTVSISGTVVATSSTVTISEPFVPGTGFNGATRAMEIQSDGKIVLVGSFTSYDNTTQNYITRLLTTGARDTGFSIGTGLGFSTAPIPSALAIQSDSKILVGGNFTSYNGTTQNYLTRLNTDGTRDTGFNLQGAGFNNGTRGIAVQSDGKIVVVGIFTTYNSATQTRIIRLNSDGTKDTGFSVGTGFNGGATAVAIQSTGKIVVGGLFTTYNGTTSNYIARLNTDGTIDTTFTTNIGTGFGSGSSIFSIAVQSDDKILVGGIFTSFNGTTQNRIIRLNSDGTRDTSFVTGTGFNDSTFAIDVQSDGNIIVGGQFSSYNGSSVGYGIAKLSSSGALNATFTTGTGTGFQAISNSVRGVRTQTDGKIMACGFFTTFNGNTANYIARLNSNGTSDS
jgi:uncharacterized delta-60 repeat protein